MRERLQNLGLTFDEIYTEFFGVNACHGPVAPPNADPPEVQLRIGVRGPDKKAVDRFTRELIPLVLNGPPGRDGLRRRPSAGARDRGLLVGAGSARRDCDARGGGGISRHTGENGYSIWTCTDLQARSWLVALLLIVGAQAQSTADSSKEWPTYGHDPGGMRFSPLTQITPANVGQLKVAWVYHMKPAGAIAPAGRGAAARGRSVRRRAAAGAGAADAADRASARAKSRRS